MVALTLALGVGSGGLGSGGQRQPDLCALYNQFRTRLCSSDYVARLWKINKKIKTEAGENTARWE